MLKMMESPSKSVSELPIIDNNESNYYNSLPEIPIDIVSEEEMSLLEAALDSASSSFTSSVKIPAIRSTHFQSNVRSIQSITVLSKRRISGLTGADIEDSGDFRSTQKKTRLPDSFFLRFRKKKGLYVTDVTATEWCEKQMEFVLLGKRNITKPMRKGSPVRHAKLEEEYGERVAHQARRSQRSQTLKMTESPSESVSELPIIDNNENNHYNGLPEIPIDIVSEEEMGLLEAALASARSSFTSSVIIPAIRSTHFQSNVRSIQSITVLSKRKISCLAGGDIEDSGDFRSTQKKTRLPDSFFLRFRKKKGLSVTDLTATEWCEKQMEFVLQGKRKITEAMRKGSARHAKLEEEVVKKVEVLVTTEEDRWALKLVNFIIGVNQLLLEGLTRELPLVSFVEGVWMVGVIDEVRMPTTETDHRNPLLVDTKTRVQETLPSEPQRRNGRLQLMCYKHMWDSLVADKFPAAKFFDFYSLNPYSFLSEDIRKRTASSGFPAETLDDVVGYYRNTCGMLPPAHDQLLLRYEFQKDQSVLGEDQFSHNSDWLKKQIQDCLEFWLGEREASYPPEEERWKCHFCQYKSICPTNANLGSTSSPTNSNQSNTTPS